MHTVSLTAGAPRLPRWLLNPYMLLALAAVSMWLLDGFNIGPVNDGWIGLMQRSTGSDWLHVGATTRVFGAVPKALGLHLGGFIGWQLMLLILTWLRAVLFHAIVRRLLPGHPLFAAACGLLALVHPADSAWFWVDATGAHLGFVLALAACWTSLAYLQGGARTWLLATFLFQLTACLTYTAYQPLMFAFPVGAWLLLWVQGAKPSWQRVAGVTALVLLFVAAQLVLVAHGVGRESIVADPRPHRVLAGYGRELVLFGLGSARAFAGFKPLYLLYALLPALLAWLLAVAAPKEDGAPRERWHFHLLMLLGLVALAAASYFPYAISNVRFGGQRQLMAAGLFLYAALAYLLFVLLPPRLARWPRLRGALPPALLALLTAITVVVGLEKRAIYVDMYRAEERVLAQVAGQVPNPRPGAIILVRLQKRAQVRHIGGFYSRPAALESGLQAMYSDASLHADFMPLGAAPLRFAPAGLVFRQRVGGKLRDAPPLPYGQLILVNYPPGKPAAILSREWLQRQAGKLDVSAYRPGEAFSRKPAPDAIMCTMLERKFRPKYCRPH